MEGDQNSVESDDWLTQYGRHSSGFRRKPRKSEAAISLILGRLTLEQTVQIVPETEEPTEDDRVRYVLAERLIEQGFEALRTPTRKNPDHVSVAWPGDWDDDVADTFESCFEGAEEERDDE